MEGEGKKGRRKGRWTASKTCQECFSQCATSSIKPEKEGCVCGISMTYPCG
jgi:hypothetical protein